MQTVFTVRIFFALEFMGAPADHGQSACQHTIDKRAKSRLDSQARNGDCRSKIQALSLA